jgi:hypothetical protein
MSMANRNALDLRTGEPGHGPAQARSVGRRLAWLVACVGAGALVGAIGNRISGDPMWFAAIPAAMAIGWLFVANPAECEPPGRKGPWA